MALGGTIQPESETERIASVRRSLDRFPWLFLLTGPLVNLLIFSFIYLLKLARESPPDRFFPSLLEQILSVVRDFDVFTLPVLIIVAFASSSAFMYAFYKFNRSMDKRKEAGFPELLGYCRATWCSYFGAILSTALVALFVAVEGILFDDWEVLFLIITPFPYWVHAAGPFLGYLLGDTLFIPPKPKEPGGRSEWTGM